MHVVPKEIKDVFFLQIKILRNVIFFRLRLSEMFFSSNVLLNRNKIFYFLEIS